MANEKPRFGGFLVSDCSKSERTAVGVPHMSEKSTLPEYRAAVEARIQEQIARNSASTEQQVGHVRMVDIQIQQERERIQKALQETANPALADTLRAVIDWLPHLARKLKTRYRLGQPGGHQN